MLEKLTWKETRRKIKTLVFILTRIDKIEQRAQHGGDTKTSLPKASSSWKKARSLTGSCNHIGPLVPLHTYNQSSMQLVSIVDFPVVLLTPLHSLFDDPPSKYLRRYLYWLVSAWREPCTFRDWEKVNNATPNET